MGKRSSFARVENDFYRTPAEPVAPLLPHLAPRTLFVEPCAGDGALVDHLTAAGHVCVAMSDIAPQRPMARLDAREVLAPPGPIFFITNPPWLRELLHAIIVHLSDQAPTWLLFDADWIHTKQAAPYLSRLRRVVSVGRVRWQAGTKMTGKDNCAWHLFDRPSAAPTLFFGPGAPPPRVSAIARRLEAA
jgi:hypothetical protein